MSGLKYIFYSWIVVGLLAACYEDNSKLPMVEYPSVVADHSQEPDYLLATYGEEFTFEPRLCKMVGRDTVLLAENEFDDYRYRWDITLLANNSDTTRQFLSQERILRTTLLSDPSSGSYYYSLTLQVTHKVSGVVKNLIWRVKVVGTYAAGLLVAETTDNNSSDISLIMSRTFNSNLGSYEDDVIYRHLYSKINQVPIDGLVSSLSDIEGENKSKITVLVKGKSITRLNLQTMKVEDRDFECFFYTPQVYHPQQCIETVGGHILLNNGLPQYYEVRSTDKYSLEMDVEYHLCEAYVASLGWDDAMFFDEKAGKFLKYSGYDNSLAELTASEAGPFDFNHLPGFKCIYGGLGDSETVRWLMEKDGHYYVYEFKMDWGDYNSKQIYDLGNCTDLQRSKCYAFSASGPVFYYGVDHILYAVPLEGSRPSPVVAYDRFDAQEEITHLLVHQRYEGRTTWSEEPDASGVPQPYWRRSRNNVLVAVTYDGREGRVYTLPIQYTGSGEIAPQRYVKCYGQFGRITAIGERN